MITVIGIDDCAFCAISAGTGPARMVYEDAAAIAFFPDRPATLGHTLVVPRAHVEDLWALDPATARPLTDAVLRVARAVREAVRPDGLNVINSAGAAASQTVFHLHVHLVPRWHGDGFGRIWPDPAPTHPPGAVEDAATAIRTALS